MHISYTFVAFLIDFLHLEVECVSYCCEQSGVDLQSNVIQVNTAACLHRGTEEQPAARMSSTAGEKRSVVLRCRAAAVSAARLAHTSRLVFLSNAPPHGASGS